MSEEQGVSAKVIAHSKAPTGEELITLEIQLHRFILPEFNTHRCLSRNFQSSRAVPVSKMIEQVRNNPATPVHWGKNQRGMVAEEELTQESKETATFLWEDAATSAANHAADLVILGVHKQVTNRILEPFMWTKGVTTATREGWDSFIKLRSHKDAQPEIKVLSDKIACAIQESVPVELQAGQWHLPYILDIHLYDDVEDAIKVSASCCGQVSYRMLDDSLEKALRIYDMLNLPENGEYKEDPPHFSPCEHIAMVTGIEYTAGVLDYLHSKTEIGGNFQTKGFFQYRKMLEQGITVGGFKGF